MTFITGSCVVKKSSIKVQFAGDDVGTILAHTCSKVITFPRGVFKDETDSLCKFSAVMTSVIDWQGFKFNTV